MKLQCNQVGGPQNCTAEISGDNPEELIKNGMQHARAAHPELANGIEDRLKEEGQKMIGDVGQRFGFSGA